MLCIGKRTKCFYITEMQTAMNPFVRNSTQMAQLFIFFSVLPPSYQRRSHLSPVMWLLHHVQLHCEPPSHLLHIKLSSCLFPGYWPVRTSLHLLLSDPKLSPFHPSDGTVHSTFPQKPFLLFLNGSGLCFYHGSDGEESGRNSGDPGLIPRSGRSPEEGHGNSLQCACLESSVGRGAGSLQLMGWPRAGLDWASFPFTLFLSGMVRHADMEANATREEVCACRCWEGRSCHAGPQREAPVSAGVRQREWGDVGKASRLPRLRFARCEWLQGALGHTGFLHVSGTQSLGG